ncbi:uncharacterized protein LOC109835396 [Asparagus officinalis]|uniref:uncharacterized protein LOC109835396 n=1 Tax=Asparagus officinalis TaxID=4686 RepID=UPI00098E7BC0|nr:uncharacterized protein LOC109835396 [Asparagus officinalis]
MISGLVTISQHLAGQLAVEKLSNSILLAEKNTSVIGVAGNLPWLLCGDFNAMITDDEKLGDTTTRVLSRLDRALVNDQWINTYNSSQAEFLLPSFSGHSPVLVTIFEDQVHGKKPFRFFKMWIKHTNYLPTVSSIWNTSIDGHTMFSICSKLKLLKIALKDHNRRHFSNISEQVLRAKVDLENAQKALSLDPLNATLICQEKDYISSFNKLLECELSFYQQKARINWNLQGDRCTNFFHSIVKNNRHKNRVMVLYNNNGEMITEGEKIVKELVSYYKSLLGSSISTDPPVIDIIKNGPCLNDLQARDLSKPVTKDEIRNAIFSMPDDKAPGPDGEETTQAIEDFFKSGKLLGNVNSTTITLIPKIQCPTTPTNFRPISCYNCIYKFISKILANRIQSVMGFIISEAQCAFVKGSKGDVNSAMKIYQCVKNFGAISGLEANLTKCSIFYGGVDDIIKNNILVLLSLVQENFKSISGIFFGGKSDHRFKAPLVSWDKICTGKIQGGLGIYSATTWNLATAMRTLWLLLDWYCNRLRVRGFKLRVKRMALSAVVYNIWKERNERIFNLKNRPPDQIVRDIKIDMYTTILNKPLLPNEDRDRFLSL